MLDGISAGYYRDLAGLQRGGVAFCFVADAAMRSRLLLRSDACRKQ
jgi:hypothetical protein